MNVHLLIDQNVCCKLFTFSRSHSHSLQFSKVSSSIWIYR